MSDSSSMDAFISYASDDLRFAEEVHRRLADAGFKVWFDKARLRPGCDWHREIEAGCEASRVVLPVLTPRWKVSEWTKFETYGAEAVIPLIFEGAVAEIFTSPLTRFQGQAIDLIQADEAEWDQLITAIRELLARPVPDKLARLAEVRFRANPYFVGREADLNRIHEALHENPTAVLTQGRVRAITALGGIGKTTLARQYIEKFWRCYPQIFWTDCRLGVETEFARLCDLFFPETRDETNVGQKAQLALRELQSRSDRLLILDNAEDEASIQAWIPKTGHCRTLITSRFAGWSAAVKSFHLDVLDPEPARTLLTTRAGRGDFEQLVPAEQTACESLAQELGYLPLALEQAAAYIGQQGPQFSFADYLRLYGEATAELLAAGVLGSTEYPDSVMTTWATTLRKLDAPPKAILRLCAFLAPTPLPLTVLTGGSLALLAEWAAVVVSPIVPPKHIETWVRQQVGQLRDYSLVDGDGQSITLHPLVQTVQRLNLSTSADECRATLARSLHWINTAFVGDTDDVRNWPTLNPLVPHAAAVVQHADYGGIADPTARLMSKLGLLLKMKGLFAEAEPLAHRAMTILEKSLGENHPDVAAAISNLAQLLHATNRLMEAEPLMRRVLDIEMSLAGDHAGVATALHNLGALLQATNRLAEAEPLMRRALAIDEQSGDKGRPDVALRLNNLASLLKATNRLAEAESLVRRALAINEQSYGTEHPDVALCLNNLAALLEATNRWEEAEPLMRRALAIDEQSYGAEHPDVALRLNNLAQLLKATNRLPEAELLLRRALAINEQFYGAEHPNVATSLSNLAQLLHTTDRLAEAEPLMRRALAIDEASYSSNHPKVAGSLGGLAQLLQATNRLAEAEALMVRAVAICEKSLGENHPHVATALNNLAQLLKATVRLEEAEPLMRRVLAIYEQSFGAEHPDVATGLNNLAGLLKDTNRLAEAESLYRRALAIQEQSYGLEHPRVAIALNNLAQVLEATNRLAEAEPLMRRALTIDEQSYGAEHSKVAIRLNNLAMLFYKTTRLSEAEPLIRRMVQILLKFTVTTGHEHPHLRITINNYAGLLSQMGHDSDEMLAWLNEIGRPFDVQFGDAT